MGVISLDLQQTDAGYDVEKEIKRLDQEIDDEVAARVAADTSIWEEIETIEAASDVVDVVGTHAALESYDTSKLQDNDIIKVLQDETRDDAITYYRWNETDSTFVYVGAEGPYYTASETDTLLAAKQDTLIAGDNITIAADGKTISATDTTYSDFAGATASEDGTQGLVPAPVISDLGKFLSANGSWESVPESVSVISTPATTYDSASSTDAMSQLGVFRQVHADNNGVRISGSSTPSTHTPSATGIQIGGGDAWARTDYSIAIGSNALSNGYGTVIIGGSVNGRQVSHDYSVALGFGSVAMRSSEVSVGDGSNDPNYGKRYIANVKDGVWASDAATVGQLPTTMTGASSSTAGTSGLVPAPAAGDEGKFLKGDGTWTTVQGGGTTTMFYSQDNVLYKDSARTVAATGSEVVAACGTGDVVINMLQYDNSALKELHVVSYVDGGNWAAIVAVSYYRNMDGGPMIIDWHYTNANSTTAAYHRYAQLQKLLTAGSNITISGSTISARDTTYSAFGGATSQVAGSAGLVPAPAIGDDAKYLKGDGTWATVQSSRPTTMFYVDIIDLTTYTATTIDLYTDDTLSTSITPSQLAAAYAAGPVIINCAHNQVSYGFLYVVGRVENQDSSGNFDYTVVSYLETGDGQGNSTAQPNAFVITADERLDSAPMGLQVFRMQGKLTAGSNIRISGDTISATDTTYTAGSGIAISAQNVISASPNNISSNDWSGLWQ